MSLAYEHIRALVEDAKRHAIKPKVVKTGKEARRMTREDPTGRKWRVGDEYYLMRDLIHERSEPT